MTATRTDWLSLQAAHSLDVYGSRGLSLIYGEGCWVHDDRGRRYLDLVAGHGAAILGHAHPRIVEALAAQAQRLISCTGAFANDVRARYLQALTDLAPSGLDRAFLCNSGTEAVEAALKLARLSTRRDGILAAAGGFHGRTYGALSATANKKYSAGCGSMLPGFQHIPFNHPAALREMVTEDTAAVILEVVQGEGGVYPATDEFLREARAVCDAKGALLILDEVQTGFGRTGTLFACDAVEVRPDILCLAKGIAAGVPMGAVLVGDRVDAPVGSHGSTFGGNPLACAAAHATLSVLKEQRLPEAAQERGQQLVDALLAARLPRIREIRHRGLMIGIELRTHASPLLAPLRDAGLLALTAGSRTLRLLPPLVLGDDEAERAVQILAGCLRP